MAVEWKKVAFDADKIDKATNVTAITDTGIADGEIAVFNLSNKDIRTSNVLISTDGTLAGDADTNVPTEKAVKTYIDKRAVYYSSDYASLAAFVTAISTTEAHLIINRDEAVAADTVIPATVSVEVKRGCIITVATGVTLTINGPFQAGLYKVFDTIDASDNDMTDAPMVYAQNTLAISGVTDVQVNDTVTVNGKAYKFVETPTDEGDVKITTVGSFPVRTCQVNSLYNLQMAINHSYGEGTLYVAAEAHPTVEAVPHRGTGLVLRARTGGTGGNALTLAASSGLLAVGGNNFSGGTAGYDYTTAGSVVFGNGAVQEIHPEWWKTNTAPGTTDMISEINAAIKSQAYSPTVRLLSQIYAVSQTIHFEPLTPVMDGANLWGMSNYHTQNGTVIKWIGGNYDTIIRLRNWTTIENLFIYVPTAANIIGVSMLGDLTYPVTTNIIRNVHVKSAYAGFAIRYGYYTSFYDCHTSYCDHGYDLRTEANNIAFHNCHSHINGVGITDYNGQGSRAMTWIGGSIELSTSHGILMSVGLSSTWLFDHTYFESNYKHVLAGFVTINGAFVNADGYDIAGSRPAFDIVASRQVRLDIHLIDDVTQLFDISADQVYYTPGGVYVTGSYDSAGAIAASIDDCPAFMHTGYFDKRMEARRTSSMVIDNGTTGVSLKCTLTSKWKGDAASAVDNIAKNATTGIYSLSSDGKTLTLLNTGITGDAIAVLSASIISNASGTALIAQVYQTASGIAFVCYDTTGAKLQDLTTLADTGAINILFSYVTTR